MARLLVGIDIGAGSAEDLCREIAADRAVKKDWFSEEDGEKILVDLAFLVRSRADDSFYAFDLVGVDDGTTTEPGGGVPLSLRQDSWENLFECIRASGTRIESKGNFWAAVQHLEAQLGIKKMSE